MNDVYHEMAPVVERFRELHIIPVCTLNKREMVCLVYHRGIENLPETAHLDLLGVISKKAAQSIIDLLTADIHLPRLFIDAEYGSFEGADTNL